VIGRAMFQTLFPRMFQTLFPRMFQIRYPRMFQTRYARMFQIRHSWSKRLGYSPSSERPLLAPVATLVRPFVPARPHLLKSAAASDEWSPWATR
jgi:hypothetical protein